MSSSSQVHFGGNRGTTMQEKGKMVEDKVKDEAALENLRLKKRLEEDRLLFEEKVREIQGYYENQMQAQQIGHDSRYICYSSYFPMQLCCIF
jgi:hypothetical protein